MIKLLRTASILAVVWAAVGPVSPVAAQTTRAQVREGNRLYEEGRFEEAHQRYLEALAADPESGVLNFNDGNALYQGADYAQAMEAYQRAIETGDPALASAAWYNLGNALYRQQQLEESLEAYKQALRLNPADPDAKHNLERVLEQMQGQQQQEQQPNDEPSEDDEEQQPDEQQQDQPQPPPPGEDESEDEQESEQDQPPPEEQQGEGQPEQQPGEMSPEEAQRLLDAIEEDPDEVDRQRANARGRRPRKPW